MIGYLNGSFLPEEEITISPYDRGFVFGDGAYEVVYVAHGVAFEIERHLERLARSLRLLLIDVDTDMRALCAELLAQNSPCPASAVIYMQVTRGVAPRTHAFPGEAIPPTVYARLTPVTIDPARQHGLRAILLPDIRWDRCDIKSVNLLPNVLATQQARALGVDEALFVRDGFVTESTRANFAAVIEGVLYTHPLGNRILPGITRALSLELAAAAGIPVQETAIATGDLAYASECMLFSTTDMVTPIVEIDGHPVGNGAPGAITRQLHEAFEALLHTCTGND